MKYSLEDEVYIAVLSPERSLEIVRGEVVGIKFVGDRIEYAIDAMPAYAKEFLRFEDDVFLDKDEVIKRIEDEFTRY